MVALIAPAPADELAAAGRQLAAKWKNAVVTVQLVLKVADPSEGEGAQQEIKIDSTGTVIDPSGLVVVALSAAIPTESAASGEEDGGDSSTEVKDAKIILNDGTEIPSKVVIRDRELDLAFVRPIDKPAKPLDAVDFAKGAKVDLMDQIIALHRLGTVASRSIAACPDRVQAVIEKPRTFYAPGFPIMAASLGAPVFAVDSAPVGLLLLRSLPGGSDAIGSGMSSMGVMYIVLPCADVLEASKQANQ
jgi:hypothetical protein